MKANTSAKMAESCTHHHLWAAQQDPYKKPTPKEKVLHNFLERSQENRPLADKLKDGTSKRIRPKKNDK